MSYQSPDQIYVASGFRKILSLNWALIVLISVISGIGFMMLYSVAGGNIKRWAEPQMIRFGIGMAVMFCVAFTPLKFWRFISIPVYLASLALLVAVMKIGAINKGAQRWIEIGSFQLQPSEFAKISVVMVLAAYYYWLDPKKVSKPLYVFFPLILIAIPAIMVVKQPDLGTSLLIIIGGISVMFFAGVSLWYFIVAASAGGGMIYVVMASRYGSVPFFDQPILKEYQYNRIETFLDPTRDPLGTGYNIIQSQIALGSGGALGKGFMQSTQSRLNFLPENHTDFIFPVLAEEFGFVGSSFLLLLYSLVIIFGFAAMVVNRDRFGALLTGGITMTFFLFFAINMAMVMGLAPVVGVPLPLVSYGGTAMLVLIGAFGLVQSAYVHRPIIR